MKHYALVIENCETIIYEFNDYLSREGFLTEFLLNHQDHIDYSVELTFSGRLDYNNIRKKER